MVLGKFDARADEGTFLGYSSRSKAYKVLNHRTSKVEESIHVKFNESLSVAPKVSQDEEEFEMPNRPITRSMNLSEESNDDDPSDDDEAPPSLNPQAEHFVPQTQDEPVVEDDGDILSESVLLTRSPIGLNSPNVPSASTSQRYPTSPRRVHPMIKAHPPSQILSSTTSGVRTQS